MLFIFAVHVVPHILKYPITLHSVHAIIYGQIKKILCPVPARITFGERFKKNFIFYFIEFDVYDTTIDCFSVKADPFCPLFQ